MCEKLSDNQIGDLLEELRQRVEPVQAQTLRGDTTLRAVNLALLSLQAGLVLAETKSGDTNDAIIDPKKLGPSRAKRPR